MSGATSTGIDPVRVAAEGGAAGAGGAATAPNAQAAVIAALLRSSSSGIGAGASSWQSGCGVLIPTCSAVQLVRQARASGGVTAVIRMSRTRRVRRTIPEDNLTVWREPFKSARAQAARRVTF